MKNPVAYMTHRLPALTMAALLAALPGRAQEASVVLKSLDNLEKRVAKVESELGRLKKAPGAAAPSAAPSGSSASSAKTDSSVATLTARVDALATRLESLDIKQTKKDAAADSTRHHAEASGAAASTSNAAPAVDSEIAALIKEVKALTAQLKDPAAKPAAPVAAQPVAKTAAPAEKASADKGDKKPALELKGDIQIQGERKLTTQSKRDNLDDFWGRVNFGAEYKGADFESKVNLRVFPEGFGFEPLTGATFDTAGQGALKTQTTPQSRLVVNHAWVKYALGDYRLKVGRFETVETNSDNYGNYVDLGPSGKFMSRPAVHNAVEASRAFGPASASVLLGTNDRKLNRGFLRVFGKYAPSKKLSASAGWRANVFDRFKFPDDEILQRWDAQVLGTLPYGVKAFAEAALLQAANREDDTPILVGIQPDCGKVLDLLAFEVEWMKTREVAKKDKEVLFNVHARKVLGRFKLDAGIWSDLSDPDTDSFSAGLRMTSGIK